MLLFIFLDKLSPKAWCSQKRDQWFHTGVNFFYCFFNFFFCSECLGKFYCKTRSSPNELSFVRDYFDVSWVSFFLFFHFLLLKFLKKIFSLSLSLSANWKDFNLEVHFQETNNVMTTLRWDCNILQQIRNVATTLMSKR